MEGKKVISKSAKRRSIPKGSGNFKHTQEVVHITKAGKNKKGKQLYDSRTVHETIS